MSMDYGEGAALDDATMRGRNWPCLRQFCVFMENRVGRLHDLLRHIERHDLKVMALSIVDSVDFCTARLIVDQYERAKELFDLSEFNVFEHDVIGVELPEDPQPYVRVCVALLQAEVNIHYTYPLLYRRAGKRGIVLFVDDIDQGLKTLEEKGLTIITEKDLLDDDSY